MAKWKKDKPSNPWISNAISFLDTDQAGSCPYCSSPNLKAYIHELGSLFFSCPDCGKIDHIDGNFTGKGSGTLDN